MEIEKIKQTAKKGKKFNRGFFGLAIISFLLPFITVSCQNTPIMRFSGVNLITGKTIEVPTSAFGTTEKKSIPGDWRVILAFLSAIIGLLTSFLKKDNSTIPAINGSLGPILLLMLKSDLDRQIIEQGQGMLNVTYGLGFWLAFFLFLAAAIINGLSLYDDKFSKSESKDSEK